jgi:sugar lactone lactonase YvrE
VVFDPDGTLYVTDAGNRCIRRIQGDRVLGGRPERRSPGSIGQNERGGIYLRDLRP